MKKELNVRHVPQYTDEQIEKATKILWGDTTKEKTEEIPTETQEKLVSTTIDVKTLAIIILTLISIGFAIGWYVIGGRERLIQEIDNTKHSNFLIEQNIERQKKTLDENNNIIQKDKKELMDKFHTIYQ